jgi:glycosyltransferase involved in cell wall biosynthesis
MRKIHSIGIFHSQGTEAFTHCAFTQKTRRLPSILAEATGLEVVCYNNEPFDRVIHNEQIKDKIRYIPMLNTHQYEKFAQKTIHQYNLDVNTVGHLSKTGTPLWDVYNAKLRSTMLAEVEPGDIILHNFGIAHQGLLQDFPDCIHVEPGIGYPSPFAPYKIYESKAWMHHCIGARGTAPEYGEFVVPHHFDDDYWVFDEDAERDIDIIYMGRVVPDKGMNVIGAISNSRPDLKIAVYGSGNAEYVEQLKQAFPNVYYAGPVYGKERVNVFNRSKISILPTQYFEPFGGAIIEAAMCGCGIITSDFGCFPETINNTEIVGGTARTLKEYLYFIDLLLKMTPNNRMYSSTAAAEVYGRHRAVANYKRVFENIIELHEYGWEGKP